MALHWDHLEVRCLPWKLCKRLPCIRLILCCWAMVISFSLLVKLLAARGVFYVIDSSYESYRSDGLLRVPASSQPQHIGRVFNDSFTDAATARPLLTLFTTLRPLEHKFTIHKNVIRNWGLLRPDVIPVLYNTSTDDRLTSLALQHGWRVHALPHASGENLPFFKSMFMDAKTKYNTSFFGYCNGDILFQEGLVKTLRTLKTYITNSDKVLVVGIRRNFDSKNREVFTFDQVNQIAFEEARPFWTDAQDYFFMARGDFPWGKVPDIVIGRRAYDNFLVGMAIQQNVSVVDASETILALHQTGQDGNTAGYKGVHKDWNFQVIGNFDYTTGHTTCAQFKTRRDKAGVIDVVRQDKRPTLYGSLYCKYVKKCPCWQFIGGRGWSS